MTSNSSWVRTITSPFRKACIFFNHQPTSTRDPNKKSHQPHHQGVGAHEDKTMGLQGEVMACGYEDVQVMWSILDKSNSDKPRTCNISS